MSPTGKRGIHGNELRNEYANEFLDMAVKDYYASKKLYEERLYPQSVFLLEQSCEKLIKVIAIFFNYTDINDLQLELGHNPHKIAEKISNKYYSGFTIEDKNNLRLFPTLVDNKTAMLEINKWFAEFFVYMSSQTPKEEYSEEELSVIIKQMNDNLKKIKENKENPGIYLQNCVDTTSLTYIHLLIAESVVFTLHLSLITQKHAIKSRYPEKDAETVFSPGKYYTEDLPLVKAMKSIYENCPDVIISLNDTMASIENLELLLSYIEENRNQPDILSEGIHNDN